LPEVRLSVAVVAGFFWVRMREKKKKSLRQTISLTAQGLGGCGAPGSRFWVVSDNNKKRLQVLTSHLPEMRSTYLRLSTKAWDIWICFFS
jgi:hypothetical protein